MRADVLLLAVKRRMAEVGYYIGPLDGEWNTQAEKAWSMYCNNFGYRHSEVPDVFMQEAEQRDVMLGWYNAEETQQIANGIMPPEVHQPPSLAEIIRAYSEEPMPTSIEDEVVEARLDRGLEAPENLEEIEAQRRHMESEQRRSITAALKAARKLEQGTAPQDLHQFLANPPKKRKLTPSVTQSDELKPAKRRSVVKQKEVPEPPKPAESRLITRVRG